MLSEFDVQFSKIGPNGILKSDQHYTLMKSL